MKKRVVALMCIVVLLLWPLAGCKKPNGPALDGAFSAVPDENEQILLPESSDNNAEKSEDTEGISPENTETNINSGTNDTENNTNSSLDEKTDHIQEDDSTISSVEGTINDPILQEPGDPADKIFCPSTLEEDFEPGKIMLRLTKSVSKYERNWPAEIFSCIDYETVSWTNQGDIVYEKENYRQRYVIIIKDKTKEATLEAIKELEQLPYVAFASPNHYITTPPSTTDGTATQNDNVSVFSNAASSLHSGRLPNDADLSEQTAVNQMDLPAAWHIETGKIETVQIGIIDTGVDFTHSDIKNYGDSWGCDFTEEVSPSGESGPYLDQTGHGTHVAGIVGAHGNNEIGISGVAWNISLVSLKTRKRVVTEDGEVTGRGSIEDAIAAVKYARTHGVKILNYSAGGDNFNADFQTEIGLFPGLFVAAAGNDGRNNDAVGFYPSNYECTNIISVAAVDQNDQLWEDSNYGATTVDLAAPGVDVYSTVPGNDYESWSGTSMAAPQVTGVAALIWSLDPTMTAADVKQAIMWGVDPVSRLNGKCVTGGRLNAFKAVTNALTNFTPPGVLTGDVTGDGLDDLVYSGLFNGKRKITVFTGRSDGGFNQAVHTFSEATFIYDHPMYIGDVNGDGKDDLVVHYALDLKRAMAVYTAKGDGTFYERINFFSTRTHNPTYYPCKLFLEDTTGDGKADFIVHWRTDQGKRCFLLYKGCSVNGKASFNEAVQSTTSVFNYVDTDPAFTGDVNGDGRTDLVIHWSENNKRRLLTYTANADGTFAEGTMIYSVRTHNPEAYPCSFSLADATGDGKCDFLVHWGDTAGKRNIMIYKGISSSGVANFEEGYYALSSIRSYVGTDLVYTGDFNGDGRTDQMVHYAINGIRNMLVYFANASGNYNEAVQISTTQQQNLTNYPCTVHIMDTNGDGKEDFVVHYRTTEWYTGFHTYKGTTSGFLTSVPTTANFFPFYVYFKQ